MSSSIPNTGSEMPYGHCDVVHTARRLHALSNRNIRMAMAAMAGTLLPLLATAHCTSLSKVCFGEKLKLESEVSERQREREKGGGISAPIT